MLLSELWIGYIHVLYTCKQKHTHTHTRWYTWRILSFPPSLFPFFLPAAHQRKADLLKRAVGWEYILSVRNEISLIFLCPLACLFLCLFPSRPTLVLKYLTPFPTLVFSPSQISFTFIHIHIFYSLFLPFPCLSGEQVILPVSPLGLTRWPTGS